MKTSFPACDLCGLPLRYQEIASTTYSRTFHFCCSGCKQVFHMLMESADAGDPETFRETELFKKCQEIGIIPRSEAELAEKAKEFPTTHEPARETEHQPLTHPKDTLSLPLNIDQMWCPACAWVVEETLKRTPGIAEASCNFATDRVRCDYNPVLTSPQRKALPARSSWHPARTRTPCWATSASVAAPTRNLRLAYLPFHLDY